MNYFHMIPQSTMYILIIWMVNTLSIFAAFEYCDPPLQQILCTGGKHFACNLDQVPRDGELLEHFTATRELKYILLYEHNFRRNLVASGTATYGNGAGKFPSASRMRELIWDDELEYLAHLHSERCNLMHDQCRNTMRFPYTGQNLGAVYGKKNHTVDSFIKLVFDGWYEEKELIPDGTKMANKYESKYMSAGHFTQIINDQVSRVGCSMSRCTNCMGKKNICYFLSCNYDLTNIKDKPVYKTSKKGPASECAHWGTLPNCVYRNLCYNNGKLFPIEKN